MEEEKIYKAMWIELLRELSVSACYGIPRDRDAYAVILNTMTEKQVKYLLEG